MSVSTRFSAPKPKIGRVRVTTPYVVDVEWESGPRCGTTDRIDLSPVITSYKIFGPLKDVALFQTAARNEFGTAMQFGDDEDLQISAATLLRLAEETMTAEQLREFLRVYKLTHGAAAAELGRSRRQIENYLAGERIPRVFVLACYGYVARRMGIRSLLRPNHILLTPVLAETETRDAKLAPQPAITSTAA